MRGNRFSSTSLPQTHTHPSGLPVNDRHDPECLPAHRSQHEHDS
jgi:hypothetical protein